jgi:hypothetical protein
LEKSQNGKKYTRFLEVKFYWLFAMIVPYKIISCNTDVYDVKTAKFITFSHNEKDFKSGKHSGSG